MSNNDIDLVERFLSGQDEAFSDLVKLYQNKIYNLALRFTGNREDAADLCQEIFIHLLNKITSFQKKSAFSTWFYRLAVNKIYDFLRKRKETLPLNEEALKLVTADQAQTNPNTIIENIELKEQIQNELSLMRTLE